MKQHFCPVEKSMIAFEKECNWCGEQEGSMTQDEIIELVQEAGIVQFNDGFIDITKDELDKFVKLVAAKAMKELENSLILMSEVNISNNFKQPQRTERPVDCERCNRLEEQIKGMANPNRGSVGVQEARPPQRTEQNFCSRCGKRTKDIHTCTPPQRTWVGLTDKNKHEIELRAGITEDDDGYIVSQVFELTEAKLKEKNT